jgi:hypothetical protein
MEAPRLMLFQEEGDHPELHFFLDFPEIQISEHRLVLPEVTTFDG